MVGYRFADRSVSRGIIARFRLKILLWSLAASLLFGLIEMGEPLEHALRIGRNQLHKDAPSGEVVIVAIDDRSLSRVGRWPWPRSETARLTERLTALGARRIFLDLEFTAPSNRAGDRRLAEALAQTKPNAILAARFVIDPLSGTRRDIQPIASLRQHAELANINFPYSFQGAVWWIPYAVETAGGPLPSFATKLANRTGAEPPGSMFLIDYSIQLTSLPSVSAVDVMTGAAAVADLRGKDVIVGTTAEQLGDYHFVPGYGRMPGVYIHAIGAETLRAGAPAYFGWLPPLLVAWLCAALCLNAGSTRRSAAVLTVSLLLFLTFPILLESRLIAVDITPALAMLLGSYAAFAWSNFRHVHRLKGATNALSGMPNLSTLRDDQSVRALPLIAARIQNYAEITTALTAEEEKTLIRQVVDRLCVGMSLQDIHHGDEGTFAWLAAENDDESTQDQVEALHALFRTGVTVGSRQIDVAITFGIDCAAGRPLGNRLASALTAANEAAQQGMRWKRYDDAKLKDASWKLSLLSELDRAIDDGSLWVAYQPKLDLRSNEVCGAEALVRWTHREKGVISPADFIPAAEQGDRIERLTAFVLEHAISAGAAINAEGGPFDIAVNLSARLIDHPRLAALVTDLLATYGLDPRRLTLEVTETAAIVSSDSRMDTLNKLRRAGVQISIDDYGTGHSTLDYLKKIPATEIKIDMSFVQAVMTNENDNIMVQSTIQLAHSLGQKVVAEGVEDRETLNALAAMECDMAQGFFIARPMTGDALAAKLRASGHDNADSAENAKGWPRNDARTRKPAIK